MHSKRRLDNPLDLAIRHQRPGVRLDQPMFADEPASPLEAALPEPLPGWTPAKVEGNAWGARFQGDTRTLPAELEGLAITVTARNGNRWRATVTGVVERSADRVLVHTRRIEA